MSCITLRFLAEPGSVPVGGKVRGGTVMKWIDEAGYACATRWAQRACVTVSMGSVRFQRALLSGDLVEVEARLAYTGQTRMNIWVEVRSGDLKTGPMPVVTECLMVFVALDADDTALPAPVWQPETPGDIALAQQVKHHLDAARSGQLYNA